MENESSLVKGEASKQAFTQVHHASGLVAPIIPRHLVPSMHGYSGGYEQSANFIWDPMVCYMLDLDVERVPARYIEHGMTTDYFGSGCRSNGYNTMGGIVMSSGGIFLSQQDFIEMAYASEDSPSSYNHSMEAFNMFLAPVMNRPYIRPSVAIIYSNYRRHFYLFSSIAESWGMWEDSWGRGEEHHDQSSWVLPDGWGLVGTQSDEGYIGWLNVALGGNFSDELNAACRYLLNVQLPGVD